MLLLPFTLLQQETKIQGSWKTLHMLLSSYVANNKYSFLELTFCDLWVGDHNKGEIHKLKKKSAGKISSQVS